jgi:hypothetical protein
MKAQRTWTLAGALAGGVALPAAYLASEAYGPSARVAFHAYLFDDSLLKLIAACAIGCALGASLRRGAKLPVVRLSLFALWIAWCSVPHLRAFPSHGDSSEREAWARARVPGYPELVRLVSASPEIARDVGRVIAVAPAGAADHSVGQEMNGFDLRFTLEVTGERGAGMLHVLCALDENRLLGWGPATWRFGGREVEVPAPPTRRQID